MSSRFWASSEDVSAESVDSSIRSAQDGARDLSENASTHGHQDLGRERGREEDEHVNRGLGQQAGRRYRNSAVVARPIAATLQPYQRANLFYLALIEGRCRTQAATAVNAGRSADDKLAEDHPEILSLSRHMFGKVRRELLNAGMLSEEFVDQDLPQLSHYLNSFNDILDNIAIQESQNLVEQQTGEVSNSSEHLQIDRDTSIFHHPNALVSHQLAGGYNRTLSNMSDLHSLDTALPIPNALNALVPQGFFTVPNELPMVLTKSFQALLQHLFPGEDYSRDVSTASIYANDFKQLSTLGAGGFGVVYKVRHKFDQGEYAVKRIVIKAETIQSLSDRGNMGDLASLIKEVQTLAKLQHHHIVCYHHCWLEPRQPEENCADSEENSDEASEETLDESAFASLSIDDTEDELQRDMRVQHRRAASGISAEIAAGSDVGRLYFSHGESREESRDDDDDVEDDDDTEEIERTDGQIVRSPKKNLKYADFDLVLYIKMSPYPLSLHEYIGVNNEEWFRKHPGAPNIRHCYHILPTVRILLSMLDGVEYIHCKNIVHRDLKPANVLLQILDPAELPTQGYVNINECQDCSTNDKPTWISPRIGDFGLIHDLSAPIPPPPASKKRKQREEESAAPGTQTYLPLGLRKSSPVCVKLDVYSLGIIAFEMSYKFGTLSERAMVLDQLKRFGKVPPDFENHMLKDCILNMVKENTEDRWDCVAVRKCLEGVLKHL
ncbi:hypothetical protein EG329_003070 [Mollisiaceae sp. DMI_Dod_QoI]|nr:hypothetical protein EG329_003070 [Helotiales sp. DMI_Dod_QoI]